MLLQIAAWIIGILITTLLGIIAFNVKGIYDRVDDIDKDIKDEAAKLWTKLDNHESRISTIEGRNHGC